jgi:transposase InsO family protein
LSWTFAERLRAVKLHLEEGFTQELVASEMGVSSAAVYKWTKQYRLQGEEGLKSKLNGVSRSHLPAPVRSKILELKQEEPSRGIKRISQLLKRVFFLPASPRTVRRTLQEQGLMHSPPKPRRNVTRPRFFERATPNQMWQTDIFTFRLGGRYAYVIAFMDDYSRFIVGADLFRSHTADNVLEVFRVAAGEYQPPKEMLTDNGREFVNWRGTTRFQAEMKKNGTHHFKSSPHHPMTLGKIERFWETLWLEFLSRAQFESFDSARERIRFWIKYYNHKRPHQGIEGLCPADRFFEIASELRHTIEAGIKENLLEMALRGQPKAPFYMVGRMEGQSVILRAEKGKLKLSIDNGNQNQELVYRARK